MGGTNVLLLCYTFSPLRIRPIKPKIFVLRACLLIDLPSKQLNPVEQE